MGQRRVVFFLWLLLITLFSGCANVAVDKLSSNEADRNYGALNIFVHPLETEVLIETQTHIEKYRKKGNAEHKITLTPQLYNATLSCPGYESVSKIFNIEGGKEMNAGHIHLMPKERDIHITTIPENATISVVSPNGESTIVTGKTPFVFKLKTGIFRLNISKEGFENYETTINIHENSPVEFDPIQLLAKMGGLHVETIPVNAEISVFSLDRTFIYKGITPYHIELTYGKYIIKITKEGYESYEKEVEIDGLINEVIDLQPNLVELSVKSTPDQADISVISSDGEELKKGKTPFITELVLGKYWILIEKIGYEKFNKEIVLTEKKMKVHEHIKLNKKLIRIAIQSSPSIADAYINEEYKGKTPLEISLESGQYALYVDKGDLGCEADITVSEKSSRDIHIILKRNKPPKNFIRIDGGLYNMGSEKEGESPVHAISLNSYWIGKFEVTVGEYKKCVDEGACSTPTSDDDVHCNWTKQNHENHPVNCVSWDDANDYIRWYSNKNGLNFRLPTEAEWELAAKGKNRFKYPWGNQWDGKRINYCDYNCPMDWKDKETDDGYSITAPVDSFENGKSPYGVYNMSGNVREWCLDSFDADFYLKSPKKNPLNEKSGNTKVVRGGSWDIFPQNTHTTFRFKLPKNTRKDFMGFRMVFSANENTMFTYSRSNP